MVSFKPIGRLGNYLFELFATIAYVKKHGLEFSAPGITNDQLWNPIYFPNLINPKFDQGRADIIINEKILFKYDEIPFKEEWRDKQIVLRGYWQNPMYFEEYREEILKAFNLPSKINIDTVSVHVRRGDYLNLKEKHPEVTKEWYEEQMKLFPKHEFVFFSDDIQWCQQQFGGRIDCTFAIRNSELEDLILMSQCEHFINSASTFSWMGAWLSQSKDKRVIVPKRWMSESHSNQWTEEIVPKEWERR